jgi:hypothetical protein
LNSRFLHLAALLLASCQLMLACGCAARGLNSADRDAPLTSIEETTRFRALLTTALECEAPYTLAGGLKPLSTGFWQGEMTIEGADLAELARVRRALAPLRNDAYYADVQVFATAHDGKRTLEAYVVHRASLAAMIDRERDFWSPLGISTCTHPAEIVAVVDRLPRAQRWRAYGLLFGYPRYAIDFFVDATERGRASDAEMGPGKDREFVHVPTASAETGRFTWAVPIGHTERAEDRAIRSRAARILSEYSRLASAIELAADPMPLVRRLGCEAATLR